MKHFAIKKTSKKVAMVKQYTLEQFISNYYELCNIVK